MEQWITLLGDMSVIVFDLALYMQMTALRKDTPRSRRLLLAGCSVIVLFYLAAINLFAWPAAAAALVCMTIPSLALFWIFSKYRDARFFLTFCFVDTVSLVVGFFARYIGAMLGDVGSMLSLVIMVVCLVFLYQAAKPRFIKYRMMLDCISTGWKQLTISTATIYMTLIFTAIYPKPLIERPEYHAVYLVICIMVVAFYMVILTNLSVTGQVYQQSRQLQEQQKWFKMAYVDALTEIPNRMAYMERVHDIERMEDRVPAAAVVVMDLDHFKSINDTWGHKTGDQVLRHAAKRMLAVFSDGENMAYRIGGDEFAALTAGLTEQSILERLKSLERLSCGSVPYSISYGYAFVNSQENNAVERAFSQADKMMYANKGKKGTVSL